LPIILSMRLFGGLLLIAVASAASPEIVQRASELYQRTEYENSLRVLAEDPAPDAGDYLLSGKNYFMSGDYKKATDSFERAVASSPGAFSSSSSEYELWLGRAWGRRAESGGWLMAASYASKARQCFEKAVALDPRNHEAKNDLFEFYLNAPGFMGGGTDKAEAAARSIASERPAEYEHEEAQLADRRKDYAAAEAHLRRAVELAPNEAGRMIDLAQYLARRGRVKESDLVFERARKMAPGLARVAFAIARADIENHRNPEQARTLLQGYLHAGLTPEDPPRQEAEKLLRRAGGSPQQ
jgi:Flp pilus assembly protein TadD